MSKQYDVSRTFLYSLLSRLKEEMENLLFPRERPAPLSKEAAEATILAQRFEGKCSIDAISTLMKRSYLPFSSMGYISQYLSRVGKHM